jgi:phosphoenolpyruvate phosphomutase
VVVAQASADDDRLSKGAGLRSLLHAPDLTFLMEAHNGLSARIVEETGFDAIWASGLTISVSLGVRDSNEASWTQVLEILEFMSDATSIPILLDGDTGYGNFNNVRRLVQKLCARGIGGVAIEDKLFPKTNSFIGQAQPLVAIDEFCGKIKAGKDSQPDDDFCIVARVEALVSGWGLDEALLRAEAYHAAGADAVLIHSKSSKPNEVLAFAREWAGRCPLVVVPTMYYATPTRWFRDAGISAVIWANHNMRAAMTAMRRVSRTVFEQQSVVEVESHIASIQDVFGIAGDAELREAERRYLAPRQSSTSAIILAAARGEEVGDLSSNHPKCMIEIQGQPLLRRLVKSFNDCGISKITVVRGYRKETVDLPSIEFVDNDDYASTGEAASLFQAESLLDGPCIISFGDILFRKHVLEELMSAPGDIVLAVDARWGARGASHDAPIGRAVDLVVGSEPYSGSFFDSDAVTIERIGSDVRADQISGRWIGLAKLTAAGARAMRVVLQQMVAAGTLASADLATAFDSMRSGGGILRAHYIYGNWFDVHDTHDLLRAGQFVGLST